MTREIASPGPAARSKNYWIALDGLRGAAVLAVILYHFHVPGARGGWLGVDVFFVLSGFVVTNNLVRNRQNGVGYTRFIARRAARLYPALILVVVGMLAWSLFEDHGVHRSTMGAVWASLAQLYNVLAGPLHLDGRGFLPLWSLGVEWQFYLIAPLIVGALVRFRSRSAAFLAAGLAIVEILMRPLTQIIGVAATTQYTATWFRLDGLLLGVSASFLYRNLRAHESDWLRRLVVPSAILLGLLVGLAPGWYVWQRPSVDVVIPLAGIATFVLVLSVGAGLVPNWLNSIMSMRWLVFLGQRAYSLYLWNYFVIYVVDGNPDSNGGMKTIATRVALTTVAALASYEFVERPARERLNHWIDSRAAREQPQPTPVHANA